MSRRPLCSIFFTMLHCSLLIYALLSMLHSSFVLLIFFFVDVVKCQFFLFSLTWILMSIIINVTIVICKTNHSLLVTILKIHYNMLFIDHLVRVKILKINCNMLCPPSPRTSENSQNPPQYVMYPPPPHMWYTHLLSNIEPPTDGSSYKIHKFIVNHKLSQTQTRVIGLLYPIVRSLAMKLNHPSV